MTPRKPDDQVPCLRCGKPTSRRAGTYLFSISAARNFGPFHASCAGRLTIAEEDQLHARAKAGEDLGRDIPI